MMMDYMLPKRVMSFKEAWEMYFEQNGAALFEDLARYGIKIPKCFAQTVTEKEHVTHQSWIGFYMKPESTPFHTWVPEPEELDWLSEKYPNTFDNIIVRRLNIGRRWKKRASASTTRPRR